MGFYNHLCPGCMNETGDADVCPYCGFDLSSLQVSPYLSYGAVVAGKYVVGEVLEQNSEGVTYLGLDTITNNRVRIREFLPESFIWRDASETTVTVVSEKAPLFKKLLNKFLDMWHSLMRIKTLDSMITVLDVFEANNTGYAIAEADGSKTLSEYLEENGGVLPWDKIADTILPVLDSLESVNEMGIVHGALSPDTLFLCGDGKFKAWGWSIDECRKVDKSISADIRAGYAAIEQYGNALSLSKSTDVYGFVSVLYKCVTGSAPIDADIRAKEDALSIPADYARELPDYVLAAFIGALQVMPEDRTPDIKSLKTSFTKEAYEKQKQKAEQLVNMSLIDPLSDISPADQKPERSKEPVVVNSSPYMPVIKKEINPVQKTSTASTIILAISIIFVMVIFFICLLLTGVISFNTGGSGAQTSVVKMPDFINYSKDDPFISQAADAYGLQITLSPASSDKYAEGVIFEQDIAPGTEIAKGSALKLTYSKGASTVTLPSFTGVPFTETVYYLGKLNLSYNIVEKENDGSNTAGTVATMTPAAGSVVFEGTEITIEIWGDPPAAQNGNQQSTTAPSGNGDITGPNTGSQVTSSSSILDSIFGRLSDSVSGIGSAIQDFLN